MATKVITVSEEVHKKLIECKIIPRESFNDVIERLIKSFKGGE